jgi:NSS family neurotransmitter:Na+ symporter
VVGALVWYLALAVVLSLSPDYELLWFGQRNLLRVLDHLTARLLLPLSALLIALLVGWRLHPEILRLELARESGLFFSLWRGLLRYIAPPAIALLMVTTYLTGKP